MIEKFNNFIHNISKVSITFWIIIFLTWLIQYINLPTWSILDYLFWIKELNKTIPTQYMFTTLWAIFAFWYWYKKYERDKELEIIEKYTKKYTLIKKENDNNLLLNLFYEEFYLKCRWFISDKLWQEWDTWITLDIYELIDSDTSEVIKWLLELKKNSKSRKISPEEISKAITKLKTDGSFSIVKYFWYHWNNNIQYKWENFIEYFISKVNELKDDHIVQMELHKENKISILNINGEDFMLGKEIQKEYCNNILAQFETLLKDMKNVHQDNKLH